MKLPLYLDDIGPDWLTYALQRDFPGVAIAAASRHGGHKGTSMSARFELVYAEWAGHDDLPDAVFVKGGFDDKWRKRVYQALQQEAEFYTDVARCKNEHPALLFCRNQ